jgi:pimeloyl-ACP methyl ester carboxylesterase
VLAGHAPEWRSTIEELRRDHRVIAIGQRGHGGSTRLPDDVSRRAYVGDVLALLDELQGDQAPVVGQSMRARTAGLVAAEAPEAFHRVLRTFLAR